MCWFDLLKSTTVPHLCSDLWITSNPKTIPGVCRPFQLKLFSMCAKDVHKLVVMVQISGIPTNETKTSFLPPETKPAELEVKSGFWREFMKEPTVKVGWLVGRCQP